MSEPRCGTCKHWQAGDEPEYPDWGTCGRIEMYEPYSYQRGKSQRAEEIALAVDGSGFIAIVRCKAEFGCVLHEEKTDE